MLNIYQQTCPVVFGCGTLGDLPEHIKSFHGTRAFCICDQGVRSTGIVNRVCDLLERNNIKVMIFDDVKPDAPDFMVNEAGAQAVSFLTNIVIGIGGGSSLDTAKAVSVLVSGRGEISDYYPGTGKAPQTDTLLILIPTSSGTGSEVTGLCVVHDGKRDAKVPVCRSANLAIVDSELTLTVPPAVMAATGFDAMSHALEAYTSKNHNQKADTHALEALRLINKYLIRAYQKYAAACNKYLVPERGILLWKTFWVYGKSG